MAKPKPKPMVRRALAVVDMVADNCPRHRVLHFLMKCPRCSRLFWEHCERVAKLPRIVRP